VYVAYKDAAHETEYYNIASDPFELNNIANKLTPRQSTELHKILQRLENCHNARACWTAGDAELAASGVSVPAC